MVTNTIWARFFQTVIHCKSIDRHATLKLQKTLEDEFYVIVLENVRRFWPKTLSSRKIQTIIQTRSIAAYYVQHRVKSALHFTIDQTMTEYGSCQL